MKKVEKENLQTYIYFHTIILEKQIPNTFLHDILHGWLQNDL